MRGKVVSVKSRRTTIAFSSPEEPAEPASTLPPPAPPPPTSPPVMSPTAERYRLLDRSLVIGPPPSVSAPASSSSSTSAASTAAVPGLTFVSISESVEEITRSPRAHIKLGKTTDDFIEVTESKAVILDHGNKFHPTELRTNPSTKETKRVTLDRETYYRTPLFASGKEAFYQLAVLRVIYCFLNYGILPETVPEGTGYYLYLKFPNGVEQVTGSYAEFLKLAGRQRLEPALIKVNVILRVLFGVDSFDQLRFFHSGEAFCISQINPSVPKVETGSSLITAIMEQPPLSFGPTGESKSHEPKSKTDFYSSPRCVIALKQIFTELLLLPGGLEETLRGVLRQCATEVKVEQKEADTLCDSIIRRAQLITPPAVGKYISSFSAYLSEQKIETTHGTITTKWRTLASFFNVPIDDSIIERVAKKFSAITTDPRSRSGSSADRRRHSSVSTLGSAFPAFHKSHLVVPRRMREFKDFSEMVTSAFVSEESKTTIVAIESKSSPSVSDWQRFQDSKGQSYRCSPRITKINEAQKLLIQLEWQRFIVGIFQPYRRSWIAEIVSDNFGSELGYRIVLREPPPSAPKPVKPLPPDALVTVFGEGKKIDTAVYVANMLVCFTVQGRMSHIYEMKEEDKLSFFALTLDSCFERDLTISAEDLNIFPSLDFVGHFLNADAEGVYFGQSTAIKKLNDVPGFRAALLPVVVIFMMRTMNVLENMRKEIENYTGHNPIENIKKLEHQCDQIITAGLHASGMADYLSTKGLTELSKHILTMQRFELQGLTECHLVQPDALTSMTEEIKSHKEEAMHAEKVRARSAAPGCSPCCDTGGSCECCRIWDCCISFPRAVAPKPF